MPARLRSAIPGFRPRALLWASCGALLALLLFAPQGNAGLIVDRFSPLDGSPGTAAGQFSTPRGVAVNDPGNTADGTANSGWYYVVDDANHRIQAFDATDGFQFMIGRDVSVAQTTGEANTAAEKCISAADCKGGSTSAFAGTLGGMFDNPQGIAINQDTGHFYVRDRDNMRVQEFEADGDFVRAWGGDVVQPGGTGEVIGERNERQSVTLASGNPFFPGVVTGGTFTLTFDPDGAGALPSEVTAAIPYDASAAVVQQHLVDDLASVAPGDVLVAGGPGPGASWAVDFTGAYANTDVAQMTGSGTGLIGTGTPNNANVATVLPGGVISGAFEVCSVASQCKSGMSGGLPGQLAASNQTGTGIAVNASNGNVVVADPGQLGANGKRVLEFQANGAFIRGWGFNVIPLGGTGDLGTTFEICTAASECQGVATSSGAGASGAFGNSNPTHVAVDSNGVVYASDSNGSGRVLRFDSTESSIGNFLLEPISSGSGGVLGSGSTTALAADFDGKLYVARANGSVGVGILELDLSTNPASVGSGNVVDTHMANASLVANGVGINTSLDDLYVSSITGSPATHRVYVLDEDGASGSPDVTVLPPTDVSAHTASLHATVNPQGFPTGYRFQYSRTGADGSWTDVAPDQPLGSGIVDVPISDVVSGLDANTQYRVRILITRGFGNGSVPSTEQAFLTDVLPPEIVTTSVGSVGETSAILTGSINPHGTPTSYHFEYGEGASYGNTIPVPDDAVGAGHGAQFVKQALSGLQRDRIYHYRLVATSQTEGVVFGPDHVFRTRSASPQGRGYELVSPADKISGGGVGSYNSSGVRGLGSGRASVDGERVAVESGAGSPLLNSAFEYANDFAFAERVSDQIGWRSHTPFTHPNYSPSARRAAVVTHVSDDLSLFAWTSNGGHIGVFPEIGSYPSGWTVGHLSDWAGRWEVAGPTHETQMAPGFIGTLGVSVQDVAKDGAHAVVEAGNPTGYVGGLSGADDPYLDRVDGGATYVDDVSAGLSDSFPGAGVRKPVGVCSSGTQLPSVDSGGDVGVRPCPSPVEYSPGQFRSGPLVSPRGTRLGSAGDGSQLNRISRDGSRVFFTDQSSGAPASCTGTDSTTSCPPQLYVRQENSDGTVAVRWLSRPLVAGQDATLLSRVVYEGASADGDKVFFKTQTPLTVDDPDGEGVAPPSGGVTTGNPGGPGNASWDLYMYDLAPGNDPTGPGASLTRVSGGPNGDADCNVGGSGTSLRFAADDGGSAYFVCSDDLAGVDGTPPSGGLANSDGTNPGTIDRVNLYRFVHGSSGDGWTFVAQLPAASGLELNSCATRSNTVTSPLNTDADSLVVNNAAANCVRGTSDGDFVIFMTRGRLVAGDVADSSADIYAFDAGTRSLSRVSAPQGGQGNSYTCVTSAEGNPDFGLPCYGDLGGNGPIESVVTDSPLGQRKVLFQSKSQLTPDDDDAKFDVYEWSNGELSLLSVGATRDVYYTGVSADGQDVFVEALDRLSPGWDKDKVMDIYDARLGGGIPDPAPPKAVCDLAAACQGVGAPPTPTNVASGAVRPGNGVSETRATMRLAALSGKARRRAAKRGVLAIRARIEGTTGVVRATARARLRGRERAVGRGSTRIRRAGTVTVKVRLAATVRRQLARGRRIRLAVVVNAPDVYQQDLSVMLKRVRK